MSEPIIFKPIDGKHELTRKNRVRNSCPHYAIEFDPDERTVNCKACQTPLDPFEALRILATRIWWEENKREREIETEEKRVARVQKAAIEHLYAAGFTPEVYAKRWQQEDEKRKLVAS